MRTLDFSKPGALIESDSNERSVSFKRTITTIRLQDIEASNLSYLQVNGTVNVVKNIKAQNLSVINVQGLGYLNIALQSKNFSYSQINGVVTIIKEGNVQIYAISSGYLIIRKDKVLSGSAQNYSYIQASGTIIP